MICPNYMHINEISIFWHGCNNTKNQIKRSNALLCWLCYATQWWVLKHFSLNIHTVLIQSIISTRKKNPRTYMLGYVVCNHSDVTVPAEFNWTRLLCSREHSAPFIESNKALLFNSYSHLFHNLSNIFESHATLLTINNYFFIELTHSIIYDF